MLKVLHLPYNVGSHPSLLSKYEAELGIRSISYNYFSSNKYTDETNTIIKEDKGILWNEYEALRFSKNNFNKFDIIHYNFGSTLLPVKKAIDPYNPRFSKVLKLIYDGYGKAARELEFKKNKGKIFVTFQGDDGRRGSILEKNNPFVSEYAGDFLKRLMSVEKPIEEINKKFLKYASKIYVLNPDLVNYFSGKAEFLPYASYDVYLQRNIGISGNSRIRIGHAPTVQDTKGTKYVFEAIESLKSEGFDIDFVLIEGLKRNEAIKLYETLDLLVDQLIIGWYGGLSLELMSMGKPVICYINEKDLRHIPEDMRNELPIINANPVTIKDVIREYITGKGVYLKEIGEKSRRYALKYHNPKSIAEKVKADYEIAIKEKNV